MRKTANSRVHSFHCSIEWLQSWQYQPITENNAQKERSREPGSSQRGWYFARKTGDVHLTWNDVKKNETGSGLTHN